jgi:hypothetical protein
LRAVLLAGKNKVRVLSVKYIKDNVGRSIFMSRAPTRQFEWWDRIFILHTLKVGLAGFVALFVAEALNELNAKMAVC